MNDMVIKYALKSFKCGGYFKPLYSFDKLSAVLLMLNKEDYTVFHKHTECEKKINLIEGGPILVHAFIKGEYKKIVLDEFNNGFTIPKGVYFSIENQSQLHYSLVVCTFSPALDMKKIIIPSRKEMLSLFPKRKELVKRLTKN